ncbi:MAG: 16S rRNA (cytidine(1402)-2'-O)-methyltransferase [Clostridiales bacterium]|nr:16S rRNA (cytidine(1402)-2'-O)-methyltransferase [Clostridiales bacterium]
MENANCGKLYIVGTPIGNLGDLSPRALEVLSSVDFIAAEDTRVTLRLLNHFGVKKPLTSYHEHNAREAGERIVSRLLAGETAALVTDAGMPAISDPGEDLVRLCHERGAAVESVPGPSALITALALSGMPSGRFCFEGFLTVNRSGRRARLQELAAEPRTMIFYEAPHKLLYTLQDMLETLGDRPVCLVRELTKLHEETCPTTLSDAVERYEAAPPKGEFVLIVGGARHVSAPRLTPADGARIAAERIEQGLSPSAAAKEAAAQTGCKKGDIYRLLMEQNKK